MDVILCGSEAKGPAHRIVGRARRPPHRSLQEIGPAAAPNSMTPLFGALQYKLEIPVHRKCGGDRRGHVGRMQVWYRTGSVCLGWPAWRSGKPRRVVISCPPAPHNQKRRILPGDRPRARLRHDAGLHRGVRALRRALRRAQCRRAGRRPRPGARRRPAALRPPPLYHPPRPSRAPTGRDHARRHPTSHLAASLARLTHPSSPPRSPGRGPPPTLRPLLQGRGLLAAKAAAKKDACTAPKFPASAIVKSAKGLVPPGAVALYAVKAKGRRLFWCNGGVLETTSKGTAHGEAFATFKSADGRYVGEAAYLDKWRAVGDQKGAVYDGQGFWNVTDTRTGRTQLIVTAQAPAARFAGKGVDPDLDYNVRAVVYQGTNGGTKVDAARETPVLFVARTETTTAKKPTSCRGDNDVKTPFTATYTFYTCPSAIKKAASPSPAAKSPAPKSPSPAPKSPAPKSPAPKSPAPTGRRMLL